MRLDLATWLEVDDYLKTSTGIIIPTGSTEQHGPMGLIGTDALCAQQIAESAAEIVGAFVAPTLAYTPAPFNTGFPGTLSVSEPVFEKLVSEILDGLVHQGFNHVYFLNGHGANLTPLKSAAENSNGANIRIRSWWEFEMVNALRDEFYGDWEGMHATPSEISITQKYYRTPDAVAEEKPARKLDTQFIQNHAGDFHPPAAQHKAEFPDGRVGAHSALASPSVGAEISDAAAAALADDFNAFMAAIPAT